MNIRFLGQVAVLSKWAHIREMCVAEMAARSCKKIMHSFLCQFISELQQQYNEDMEQKVNIYLDSRKGSEATGTKIKRNRKISYEQLQ